MRMTLWHRSSKLAYLAVFVGVLGHSSSEFISVLSGIDGPELSVWRFVLGGTGLVVLALFFPGSRNLIAPFRTFGLRLIILSALGVTTAYLFFHWSLNFASVVQVATVVTTIPIFVALANLIINRQPITFGKTINAICAIVGIVLLITDGYFTRLTGSAGSLLGVFMAIACAAAVAYRHDSGSIGESFSGGHLTAGTDAGLCAQGAGSNHPAFFLLCRGWCEP